MLQYSWRRHWSTFCSSQGETENLVVLTTDVTAALKSQHASHVWRHICSCSFREAWSHQIRCSCICPHAARHLHIHTLFQPACPLIVPCFPSARLLALSPTAFHCNKNFILFFFFPTACTHAQHTLTLSTTRCLYSIICNSLNQTKNKNACLTVGE